MKSGKPCAKKIAEEITTREVKTRMMEAGSYEVFCSLSFWEYMREIEGEQTEGE